MAERCTCGGCGQVYSGDLLVPDQLWAVIAPLPVEGWKGGGLLCPACIVERLGAAGLITAFTMATATLVQSARALLECVDFDNNGIMVGMVRTGGNGGLISHATTRAADQLRQAIERLDHLPHPQPDEATHG